MYKVLHGEHVLRSPLLAFNCKQSMLGNCWTRVCGW